eukprot:NODE_5502_length_940_cov_82.128519_g5280_i0.p1 GENE.NODE_5502_length_940_cov_82.128519_g5280_i0~~NODE_5502_length_940_cov_82.128519_g5280_i0.p1  ORF type:complete len:272 (-),score=37.45 NODE_5502_length_940_cov_82.128519_g5280_i0:73-888(-)
MLLRSLVRSAPLAAFRAPLQRAVTAPLSNITSPTVPQRCQIHSSSPILKKDKGGKAGKGASKELKGGKGSKQRDARIDDEQDDDYDEEFTLDSFEETMQLAVVDLGNHLGRLVTSSRTPQGQLSALSFMVEGKPVYLTELNWPVRNLDQYGHEVEITTPSPQDASTLRAVLKKEFPDLQSSQTKATIAITFAQVTDDLRASLARRAKKDSMQFRQQIQAGHTAAIKALDKVGVRNRQERKLWETKIKALHDVYIKKLEAELAAKTALILAP